MLYTMYNSTSIITTVNYLPKGGIIMVFDFWSLLPFILFCVIFVLLLLFFRSKEAFSGNQFDERQELLRGQAYKNAFVCMTLIGIAFFFLLDILPDFGISGSAALVITVFAGLLIFAVECVWKEAFFSLHQHPKKLLILYVIIGVINTFNGCVNLREENVGRELPPLPGMIMLSCGILFLAVAAAIILRTYVIRPDDN